ncbi:hypothetical protein HGRIS_014406 [Hohenbuehelia grisea]|uniref:Protein kinase domain-containing protein n=1 Tax=Hohenbuehelia grisea TaxID=104357 RepID=A0ABR3JTY5_9AGAR
MAPSSTHNSPSQLPGQLQPPDTPPQRRFNLRSFSRSPSRSPPPSEAQTRVSSPSPLRSPIPLSESSDDSEPSLAPQTPNTSYIRHKNDRVLVIVNGQSSSEAHPETPPSRRNALRETVGIKVRLAAQACIEGIRLGTEALAFVPIPGLAAAALILVNIWDAVEKMGNSATACMRLAERCADVLLNIREVTDNVDDTIGAQLADPLHKLKSVFARIETFADSCLHQQLPRFLRHDEIMRDIEDHHRWLTDTLWQINFAVVVGSRNQATDPRRAAASSESLSLQPDIDSEASSMSSRNPPSSMLFSNSNSNLPVSDDAGTLDSLGFDVFRTSPTHESSDCDQQKLNSILQLFRGLSEPEMMVIQEALRNGSASIPDQAAPSPTMQSQGERGRPVHRKKTWPLHQIQTDPAFQEYRQILTRIERKTDASKLLIQLNEELTQDPPWRTIPALELRRDSIVHRGQFSDVYHGHWRGNGVAIKLMHHATQSDSVERFISEFEIWRSLKHPNVLEIFGVRNSVGTHPRYFVSPYMENGNLSDVLKGLRWRMDNLEPQAIDSTLLLRMMTDISIGLWYIHRSGIIHGDIKASNVLVNGNNRCLINDFGHSLRLSTQAACWHPNDSLRWRAPELLLESALPTQAGDVYSFGICCAEILTIGCPPWPLLSDEEVLAMIRQDDRQSFRESLLRGSDEFPYVHGRVLHSMPLILDSVCHLEPPQRPIIAQVVHMLRAII